MRQMLLLRFEIKAENMQAASLHLRHTMLLLLAHAPPPIMRSSASVTGSHVLVVPELSLLCCQRQKISHIRPKMMSNLDFSKYISAVDAEILQHFWGMVQIFLYFLKMQTFLHHLPERKTITQVWGNAKMLQHFYGMQKNCCIFEECRNIAAFAGKFKYCSILKECRNVSLFPKNAEILQHFQGMHKNSCILEECRNTAAFPKNAEILLHFQEIQYIAAFPSIAEILQHFRGMQKNSIISKEYRNIATISGKFEILLHFREMHTWSRHMRLKAQRRVQRNLN
ncbi:hypothetical protein FQA47_024649 [Oryzias melastigma]|uniref:Uncharacterized protein n=1 Tax=Oryzias melastigma TaxID=30732 RepID=A0A834CN17_ORYME|nr:hypothetical protein FQA47_024649 [Oryzias melastigma]